MLFYAFSWRYFFKKKSILEKVKMPRTKSAYDIKNNCCLFERRFEEKKNSIFLFGISFFVLEIFMFLHYANEESDDVTNRSS